MKTYDEKIKKLWDETQPVLTDYERRDLINNIWARIEHRKKLALAGKVAVSVVVMVMVVIIALNPFSEKGTSPTTNYTIYEGITFYDPGLAETLATIPEEQIYEVLAAGEIDSIANAVLNENDINDALNTLTEAEQETLLLALADRI